MAKLPPFSSVKELRLSKNPALDAWLHHFLTENNIVYSLNPARVASPEQMRFMVALEDDQIYVPCADDLFRQFYEGNDTGLSLDLRREYAKAWRFIGTLVHGYKLPTATRRRILLLCRYRFQLYQASGTILPSRLIKRLVGIVLSQTGDMDPFSARKQKANKHMTRFMRSSALQNLLAEPPSSLGAAPIPELRWLLDYTELSRLFRLSTFRDVWEKDLAPGEVEKELREESEETACLHDLLGDERKPRKKILYIPDVAGGFIVDLAIIRALLRQGHQVILALKDAFYFNSPTIWDMHMDPSLMEHADTMRFLEDNGVSKNELLRLLREYRLVVISDGTSEQMNLYRSSITFARAWKECDLVIAKGRRNSQVFLGTSHDFTRDLLCFWREDKGLFRMRCKPKAPGVRKFSERDLSNRADAILDQMREARDAGKSVMFYSAIIGSVPGQTKTAVEVVGAFVKYLRERMEHTFIINPAEYFEEGMDGDDLMFMWERVQRGGLIDVWRFQTSQDIEDSFALMGRKVPPVWLGKDATFSTGCTKEMHTALNEQARHPELQIIGPSPEKFFRRREYGVGKYFDATIVVK